MCQTVEGRGGCSVSSEQLQAIAGVVLLSSDEECIVRVA